MADKAKNPDAKVAMKVSDVPADRKAAYIATMEANDTLDSKWDIVITIGMFCITLPNGNKIVDEKVRTIRATEYALTSVERDGIGEKSDLYKDALTKARRHFSNQTIARMRPSAKIRGGAHKAGEPLPAGPFAGWMDAPATTRAPKSSATNAATVAPAVGAAGTVAVAALRPHVMAAMVAATLAGDTLTAFAATAKLSKAQASVLQNVGAAITDAIGAVTAIGALLPPLPSNPADALGASMPAPAPIAPETGNGAGTVQ